MTVPTRSRIGILVLLPVLLTGSVRADEPPSRPNLVVITIDALRADHIGCYGYHRATTPALDELAERGVVFEQVIAPLPRTTQALATLLTGRDPLEHGVLGLRDRLDDGFTTLGELYRDAGYATAAFVNHPLPLLEAPGMNLGQGFQTARRAGGKSTDQAILWLQEAREPFFLWLHILEPHWDYSPPPETDLFTDPGYPRERYKKLLVSATQGSMIYRNDWEPADRQHAMDRYDGDILAADRKVARLLQALGPERTARTDLAVLADHGEGFGEHDYYFDHGEVVHEEVLRIPWIMAGPSCSDLVDRFQAQVSLMEVAPTLLEMAGLDGRENLPGRSILGPARRSLLDWVPWYPRDRRGPIHLFGLSDTSRFPENPNPAMRESRGRHRFVRTDRWKLVVIPWEDREDEIWLYDLQADPGETRNLALLEPCRTEELRLILQEHIRSFGDPLGGQVGRPLQGEDLETMRALGYVN